MGPQQIKDDLSSILTANGEPYVTNSSPTMQQEWYADNWDMLEGP
eukprot:CAMPEP_0114505098 /NCGR_PEP_ID=MMETSP0109-20121206/10661_1 /TAXON_ID=29199 /ORGANISM="Chlorarachnion reptans, Strain CCCM449" /LENGTH=44 /DNA_ID= /DNA_START= /DNA_END= /DNA_ORIENTATION=